MPNTALTRYRRALCANDIHCGYYAFGENKYRNHCAFPHRSYSFLVWVHIHYAGAVMCIWYFSSTERKNGGVCNSSLAFAIVRWTRPTFRADTWFLHLESRKWYIYQQRCASESRGNRILCLSSIWALNDKQHTDTCVRHGVLLCNEFGVTC